MKLLSDWQSVALRAWSMQLLYLHMILAAVVAVLPVINEAWGVEPQTLAIVSLFLNSVTAALRVLRQSSLAEFAKDESGAVSRRGVAGVTASAAGLAALIAFVAPHEGLRTAAYLDPVGIPTICYGETRGVALGQSLSKAECDRMFAARLIEFETGLNKCLEAPGEIPAQSKIAFVSWSYNVGLGAACRSTLVRKANAGDLAGACNELPRWNKAGGQVWPGLVKRRAAEREICLAGLSGAAAPVEPLLEALADAPLPEADRPSQIGPQEAFGALAGLVALLGLIVFVRSRRA